MGIIHIHLTKPISPNTTVLEALREAGCYIPAICAGRGTCGKCAVQIIANTPPASEADRALFTAAHLQAGYRLACTTIAAAGMTVRVDSNANVSEQASFDILSLYEPITAARFDRFVNNDSPQEVYGLAVDIGTTTIAFELVTLTTGKRAGVYAAVNRQRTLGADVISRIEQAGQGKQAELRAYVTEDIRRGVEAVCARAGVDYTSVREMAVAGNTTMLHILLDYPCESLGHFPFTPVSVEMTRRPFCDLFGDGLLTCTVTVLPGVSAFVGADITAGILFCGGLRNEKPRLLVDLGTNGEMVLFYKETVIVTSTAAGPAFEAGNISHGTGSVAGAIAKVSYLPEKNVYSYETIGGQPPMGLCGTGVLDTAAQLVKHGLVDETGLLDDAYFEDGVLVAPEADIRFTQKDMREIQLAKSAVRAGMEVLLAASGLTYGDIEKVCLAGGFGHKINLDSAEILGLIPTALRDKVVAVGNSALGGTVRILTEHTAEVDVMQIAEAASEINLSADPRFNDLFMEHMMFE